MNLQKCGQKAHSFHGEAKMDKNGDKTDTV